MGKAIISTPFANKLPAPLTHGENIYFVSGNADEIRKSIIEINNDVALRNRLEQGALDYYNKYIEPKAAIRNILKINFKL